jgi:SAM-dependent methyltransferase
MPLGRFGADLLVGALAVGTTLGLLGALIAYRAAVSARRHPEIEALIAAASRRYLDCGMFAWEFVRGKLRHDPLYFGVVGRGLVATVGAAEAKDLKDGKDCKDVEGEDGERGVVLDLGCGRGILFSLILAVHEIGARPPGWGPTPRGLRLIGFEGRPKIAAQARKALGEEAEISSVDLATAELPRCRVALLLDVLHYLPAGAQENLLDRVAAALEPGGTLLLRDADAEGGGRYWATRVQERLAALARGDFRRRFHYRSAREWRGMLEARGLVTETAPLSEGTPYANVLVVGRNTATKSSPAP